MDLRFILKSTILGVFYSFVTTIALLVDKDGERLPNSTQQNYECSM
jgi:hypothetical protein